VSVVFGQANSIAELVQVIQTLFIGPIVDTFGRKNPMIIGQVVAGLAFLAAPYF